MQQKVVDVLFLGYKKDGFDMIDLSNFTHTDSFCFGLAVDVVNFRLLKPHKFPNSKSTPDGRWLLSPYQEQPHGPQPPTA